MSEQQAPGNAFIACAENNRTLRVWFDGARWGGDAFLANVGESYAAIWRARNRLTLSYMDRRLFVDFCERYHLEITAYPPEAPLPEGAVD